MSLGSMVIGDEGDNIYPGSGPPMEVKPYVLLDYIDDQAITMVELTVDGESSGELRSTSRRQADAYGGMENEIWRDPCKDLPGGFTKAPSRVYRREDRVGSDSG